MMWAACCVAFFFLRSSEFTVQSLHQYDSNIHLSLADITVDNSHALEVVQLYIKKSKTTSFRQGAFLHLGRTNYNVCPVKVIMSYLAIRGKHPGPLFLLPDNATLSRNMFASALKDILHQLGLNTQLYNTHTFWIGAATAARNASVSIVDIKSLGRWKSDAYQHYIRTSPKELATLSKQFVQLSNT